MMKYKVHRFNINMEKDQTQLEQYLNSIDGEIVSIIPNVKPTFMAFGGTAKVDFLYIIEKIEE